MLWIFAAFLVDAMLRVSWSNEDKVMVAVDTR